ncbi:MAG: hypothetical protein WCE58_04105 [Gallionella sp.]
MPTYKKFSIRVQESTCDGVEKVAQSNGISRNAAIELLLKLGLLHLHNEDAHQAQFERIEARLRAMQRTNYKALVYLATATEADKPRYDKAEAAAVRNAAEIFGEAGK